MRGIGLKRTDVSRGTIFLKHIGWPLGWGRQKICAQHWAEQEVLRGIDMFKTSLVGPWTEEDISDMCVALG